LKLAYKQHIDKNLLIKEAKQNYDLDSKISELENILQN
jgi:hypothetical protein